jgi:hypothetical protein
MTAEMLYRKLRVLLNRATSSAFYGPMLLASIPLIMAAANTSWLYTNYGWLDPWYNVAYFMHYNDPTFLNDYYKISRLSWIIPGFIIYHIFNPITANFILHVGCLSAASIFLYATIKLMFDRTIAFITAAMLVVYVPFHGSGGWDYQNTPAGTFYLASFYFLTAALYSPYYRRQIFLSGLMFAATIHAAISFINLFPILCIQFVVLFVTRRKRYPSAAELLTASTYSVFGFVVLTLGLGLINAAIGRDLLFFKPLVELVISLVHDSAGQAPWWTPWNTFWFLQSWWYLVFPGAVAAVSFILLLSSTLRQGTECLNPLAISLQIQYLLTSALWIIWQSLGHTALQPNYFAYPLIPVAFLAVAGVGSMWRATQTSRAFSIWLSGLTAAILIAPLSIGTLSTFLKTEIGRDISIAALALALVTGGLVAVARDRWAILIAAITAFSALNFFSAASYNAHLAYRYNEPCADQAETFQALIDSNHFLTQMSRGLRNLNVWWNGAEILRDGQGCEFRIPAFAHSMTSFGANYLAPPWKGMPTAVELPDESIRRIATSQEKIAVPTANPANIEDLIRRFARGDVRITIDGRTVIRTSRFAFYLYVLTKNDQGMSVR